MLIKNVGININNLSEAKLKEGDFTDPNIKKLLTESLYFETMIDREKEAWDSYKNVVHQVFGEYYGP